MAFFWPHDTRAQTLSPLGNEPVWSRLDAFQSTITEEEFRRLLDKVFAPGGAWHPYIHFEDGFALIKKTLEPPTIYRLELAGEEPKPRPEQYWRTPAELGYAPSDRPLAGMRIALDPGHLGGAYARMEERWFHIGEDNPVTEGDMVLRVANMLAPRLRALGAEVHFVRRSSAPVTRQRTQHLMDAARDSLALRGRTATRTSHDGPNDPLRGNSLQFEAERLFYRTSEIRARADLINQHFVPDLVICIHFNAESWGEPEKPELVDVHHLHLLINGCYDQRELSFDDIRFEMLIKLLNGSHPEELATSNAVASSMARVSGLPPYVYLGSNAHRMSEYVWARNLLANRIFEAPTIYLEPYVMNSLQDYPRIQAGDYSGERMVGGKSQISIYQEYLQGVVEGLAQHYREIRRAP
ncbi:MAG: hypothetical protein ACFCU3_03790 [Verrucomicrobiales bacterium]